MFLCQVTFQVQFDLNSIAGRSFTVGALWSACQRPQSYTRFLPMADQPSGGKSSHCSPLWPDKQGPLGFLPGDYGRGHSSSRSPLPPSLIPSCWEFQNSQISCPSCYNRDWGIQELKEKVLPGSKTLLDNCTHCPKLGEFLHWGFFNPVPNKSWSHQFCLQKQTFWYTLDPLPAPPQLVSKQCPVTNESQAPTPHSGVVWSRRLHILAKILCTVIKGSSVPHIPDKA